MKALTARVTKGMNLGCILKVADNSGGKLAKLVGVVWGKSTRGRQFKAGVSDLVKVSIKKATDIEMRKKVFPAIIIRQKKEYRRLTGERISFADNACVILKDEKNPQNPKGTEIKGPIAREVAERWDFVAKIARIVV